VAPSVRRFAGRYPIGTLAIVLLSGTAVAQTGETHRHTATPAPNAGARSASKNKDAVDPTHAVHDAMSGAMSANPHMRMSPEREATASDSARAAQLVADARTALVKYKDVRVAEREGYQMFAPNVKNQPVYHFTKLGAAIREHFAFDPARPSSLLYKKNADGTFRLIGAMYTAPKDASPEDLDARVPLGIARWHLHTNMCVPRLTQQKRWWEVSDGKMVFGPMSPIATPEACKAVDGRFLPVVFNWMVHANVFETDVWGDHH
jgi:hypothetical protein